MMMKILKAGGMKILTDEIRTADEDNPKGYYELERVKQLEHDQAWLEDAGGKAVKIIAALLKHLPSDYTYRVVFMRRRLEEILASQKKMLVRRGEPTDTISDEKMAELFRQHLKRIETWLDERLNIKVLYVNYNEVIEKPVEHAQRINQFLGNTLNVENMTGVVDKALYRQRQQ